MGIVRRFIGSVDVAQDSATGALLIAKQAGATTNLVHRNISGVDLLVDAVTGTVQTSVVDADVAATAPGVPAVRRPACAADLAQDAATGAVLCKVVDFDDGYVAGQSAGIAGQKAVSICPGGLSTVLSATQTQHLPGWDGNPTPSTDVVVAKAHVASIQSVTQDACSGYDIVLTFDDTNGAVLAAMQNGGWVFWNQITSLQPGTFNIGDMPLGLGNNSFSVCGTGGLWTGTHGGQSCPAVISWVQWAQTDGNGHTQMFCILQPCDNAGFATNFVNGLVGQEVCICTMQAVGGGNPADLPPSLTFNLADAYSTAPQVIVGATIWSDGGNGGIGGGDYNGQWYGTGGGWLRATWIYDDGPDTANAVDFGDPPWGSCQDVAAVTITTSGNRTPVGLQLQWISSLSQDSPPTYGGNVNVQFIGSNG